MVAFRLHRLVRTAPSGVLVQAAALIFLFALYQYAYHTYSAVPGNNAKYPLGWWGWMDQGLYLKSSTAFAALDFRSASHFYPPLYPAIGAFFLPFSRLHPFYLVDLVLMAGFFLLVFSLFQHRLGARIAVFPVVAGMALYPVVGLQWVVPWTSTLSAFLVVAALVLFDQFERMRSEPGRIRSFLLNGFLFGVVVGSQIPVRPADIATVAPVAILYAIMVFRMMVGGTADQRRRGAVAVVGGIAGFSLPLAFFIGFNLASTGTTTGRYFGTVVTDIGFDVTQVPERLFSLFVASQPYFLEFNADWISVIPVFFIAVVFAIVASLFSGPATLRVAGAMMAVQLLIYASYRDSLPIGMFRYYNVHYYKWMFPVALGIAVFHLKHFIQERRKGPLAASVLVLVLISCVTVSRREAQVASLSSKDAAATVVFQDHQKIQVIDLMGLSGRAGSNEMTLATRVTIDGVRRKPVSEYRVVANEKDVRLLLFKPEAVHSVTIHFSKYVVVPESGWTARAALLPFTFGLPLSQQTLDTTPGS